MMRRHYRTMSLTLSFAATASSAAAQQAGGRAARCEKQLLTQLDAAKSARFFSFDLADTMRTQLRYVGARHSTDSLDTQVAEFEALWRDLRPTIAFYEGTGTLVGPTVRMSYARSMEPGLVRFLARQDGVEARSLEPTRSDEVDALLKTFTAEQLMLFFVTRPVTELRDLKRIHAASLDSVLGVLLAEQHSVSGLRATVRDPAEYRAAFRKWFADLDPFNTPSGWFNPERTSAQTGSRFMNDVNRASSAFRDAYMYRLLIAAWQPGARIFAVVGRAHVSAQAPALLCFARGDSAIE